MSTSTVRWRQLGFSAAAAALMCAATFAGAGTASAAATTTLSVGSFDAVLPNTEAAPIGAVTITEATAGDTFAAGTSTDVTLTLGDAAGATFTAEDVTPTIDVPTGYAVTAAPTTAATTYTFTVTAAADVDVAAITVSGLKVDAAAATQITIDSSVDPDTDRDKVLNVINYDVRFGGDDRYETAAELFDFAVSNYPDDINTDNAVLASGELYPDALSANYLAGELKTSTLLTRSDKLSPATKNTILTHNVKRVYIIGGEGAVSASVEAEIEALSIGANSGNDNVEVVRISGDDRYETNEAVNRYEDDQTGEIAGGARDTVLLASGLGFGDALAMGPIAYQKNYPLILTRGDEVNANLDTQLGYFDPEDVVIAGGTAVVSTGLEAELEDDGYTVSRLAGQNRSKTAAAIATWATEGIDKEDGTPVEGILGQDQGFDDSSVAISNGRFFADALSAGPIAGMGTFVILLADKGDKLGDGTAAYLNGKLVGEPNDGQHLDILGALGLEGAVDDSVMKDAALAVQE